ncbi:MAG: serine/threonine protein kinase, partial [Myxococcales bacterium]
MSPDHPQVAFGRYSLTRRLAKGGMAELFLALRRDNPRGGPVVVKRILPHFSTELEFVKMFLNEARIAAQLAHPNIIQIFDLGQESGHFFLAMEFMDGHDLESIAKKAGGTVPPLLAARIGAWLADALYYANKNLNVIHRDVTPGNVMVNWSGMAKLVDFGIAKATDQLEKTRPGVVKGKFRYMSPEQISQLELDGRTDLFSLGVLLYEITTGQKPFERKQILQTLQAVQSYAPPPPHEVVPAIPEPLSRIIMRALEKNRDRRYRTGREMHGDLEEFLRTAPPVGPAEIAAFLRRLYPDSQQVELITDPGLVQLPAELPTRPGREPLAPTDQIRSEDARRMLAEAERRHTRNQRAVEPPRPPQPALSPDELNTSQMTVEEVRRQLNAIKSQPAKPTPPPEDWELRTGVLGPEELADVRENSGAKRLA